MPKQDFWTVCLHAVPLRWHRPRPSCFPTGSLRAEVQQPCPGSSSCTQLCGPPLWAQPSPSAGLAIPAVSMHSRVPKCQVATRTVSSQYTCVGFVPFPSQLSKACMALQRGGTWWKPCLLFSRFLQQVSTENHMFSVTHGLQHQ